MAEQGLDMILLSSPENMEYISGFQAITYTRPIRLVVTETETHLIVPALEEEHARMEFEQYGTTALYDLISGDDYPYTFSFPT